MIYTFSDGFAILKGYIVQEEIRGSELLNTYLGKEHPEDKSGILDVRVLLCNGTQIDIEIQVARVSVWSERSLFYVSKVYTEQIKSGDKYAALKKCISISILDFRLFEDSEEFYSCFHILEDNRHTLYTDKMEFHVIELPKVTKEIQPEDSKLTLWAKFINAEREEDFEMIAAMDECIDSAYQRLKDISRNKEKRFEYEAREKAIRDHKQFMADRAEWERKAEESRQEAEKRKREAEESKRELEIGRREFEIGRREFEKGKRELEKGRRELEKSKREAKKSRRDGIKEGLAKGEEMLALLIKRLTDDGRVEDISKALSDSEAREEFYKEYDIKALLK